jgi:hypothetical protein
MDLFCKGLIICYGNGNRSINFDDLDLDKFKYIKTKMANAGIIINMNVIKVEYLLTTSINSDEIEGQLDDLPLESYHFKIYNNFFIYDMSFELHRV